MTHHGEIQEKFMAKVKDKIVDINAMLDDLERAALDICKKNSQPLNENDTFESRAKVKAALEAANCPSKDDMNRISLAMLDWYCCDALSHDHDEASKALVVKSLKQDWVIKGITTLNDKIKELWDQLHQEVLMAENEDGGEVVVTKKGRGRPKGALKQRLIEGGKNAVTKSLVRKGARVLTESTQQTIISLLMGGSTDNDLRQKVAGLLDTDIGQALVAGGLSVLLESAPFKIPGLSDDVRGQIVEELQINCVDVGTRPIENIAKMALPMITSAFTPLLTSSSESNAPAPAQITAGESEAS